MISKTLYNYTETKMRWNYEKERKASIAKKSNPRPRN